MTLASDLGRRASFRLGAVDVRPSACELVGPRGRATLEPRVMQVLVTLADAAGETVTRDQLIDACWDGRIVSDDAINRVVLRIRQAGRSVATDAFTLQTIRKVGFRLLAGATPPAADDEPKSRARTLWPTAAAAAALVLAVGLVLATGNFTRAARPAAASATALNPAAHDLALRGSAALFEGTPQQTAQGVDYFRAAVRQSPDVADLWGSLAMASVLDRPNLPPAAQQASAARIRETAERALELDPREAHGWAALEALSPTFGAWAAKDDLVTRTRAHVSGNAPPTLRQQMLFLASTGRTGEALSQGEHLLRLHPMVPFINADVMRLQIAARRFEAADAIAARARQLWPRDHELWRARFELALAERDGAAAAAMAADRATWPAQVREADMARRGLVARALASGRPADADAALAAYSQDLGEGQGYLEEGIAAAAALSRPDLVFRLATRLYGKDAPVERLRFKDHVEYAVAGERRTDLWFGPFADRVWTDPRFLPLMERIGLVAYWRDRTAPDLCATEAMREPCRRHGVTPSVRVASRD